jgi:perosamine synthetase
MQPKRIPVSGPSITAKEIEYVTDAVTNAWYGNANVWHDRFERAFSEYLEVPFAVALPSCTSAIHLALAALGVGPGDEVVVPEATWIASAAPVTYLGATPVFADIDPRTWCMSPTSFEACITPRTKAVVPVDLYGNMADWAGIGAVAKKAGVAVVEDAAEAVGASFGGRKAGTFGDAGVFSFHGSKTLTTGEGGLLATHRRDLYDRVLHLRDHGRKPGDRFFRNTEVAYKYKMSSLQAALGTAQLERIDQLVERKRAIFGWYRAYTEGTPGLTLNYEAPGTFSVYWMVTAVFDSALEIDSFWLQDVLLKEGVDTRPFFHPLSSLQAYESFPQAAAAKARNKVAYDISPRAINLPSALNLEEVDVARVCKLLRSVIESKTGNR